MAKAQKNVLGAWAFLVGVILALVVGLAWLSSPGWIMALVVLGIIIGLLNVGGVELKDFMLAGAVLVVVSYYAGQGLLGLELVGINIGGIIQSLIALFVPATIVVALKAVFALARK